MEYWIYLPTNEVPDGTNMISALIESGKIATEGVLVLRDIHLRLGFVLKKDNISQFRPDLLVDAVGYTKEVQETILESQSVMRIRYYTEGKINIQAVFGTLPKLAVWFAEQQNAKVIYDSQQHRCFTLTEFENLTSRQPSSWQNHVSLTWMADRDSLQSHGLEKLGLKNFETVEMEVDEKLLVEALCGEAVSDIWKSGTYPESLRAEQFGSQFLITVTAAKKGEQRATAKLMRVNQA